VSQLSRIHSKYQTDKKKASRGGILGRIQHLVMQISNLAAEQVRLTNKNHAEKSSNQSAMQIDNLCFWISSFD
jgi:hypothetical protein